MVIDDMEVLDGAEYVEPIVQDDLQTLTEVPAVPENFLEKPFAEYTTTEGLLLVVVLLLVLSQLMRAVKEGFRWL